jgi:hypothetical protein
MLWATRTATRINAMRSISWEVRDMKNAEKEGWTAAAGAGSKDPKTARKPCAGAAL